MRRNLTSWDGDDNEQQKRSLCYIRLGQFPVRPAHLRYSLFLFLSLSLSLHFVRPVHLLLMMVQFAWNMGDISAAGDK